MNHIKRAKNIGRAIEECYQSHGVEIEVVGAQIVLGLLRYIFTIKIPPGTKVRSISDLAEDVQVSLGLPFFYPFRNDINVHIAVSEYNMNENSLVKILRCPLFTDSDAIVPYAIGYDLWGNMHVVDLVKLRHLLIAGPTGTGKSVALQCLIISIIASCPVSSVNLLLFDIGGGSLSAFGSLTHLSHPIVEDIETGIGVLDSLVQEMNNRYSLDQSELNFLPYLVCVIDEFDSMITNTGNKMESQRLVNLLNNLLRRGRKAKIIVILASHNPTLKNVKVDLGMITARISFYYTKHQSSSTALGITGAQKLSGDGAMIFNSQTGVQSLKGAFITPGEIERILNEPPVEYDDRNKFIVTKSEPTDMQRLAEIMLQRNAPVERDTAELAKIILWVLGCDTVAANQIMKEFKMGNRAYAIVDELCQLNIVTAKFANQPRKVIPRKLEDLSPEVFEILTKHSISPDDIATILEGKSVT